MKPFWRLKITKSEAFGEILEDTILLAKERVPEKMKDYWLMIPVALQELNVTQVNPEDSDEDVTYNLKPTGDQARLLPFHEIRNLLGHGLSVSPPSTGSNTGESSEESYARALSADERPTRPHEDN